jgi:hypothetical protein
MAYALKGLHVILFQDPILWKEGTLNARKKQGSMERGTASYLSLCSLSIFYWSIHHRSLRITDILVHFNHPAERVLKKEL